MLIHHTIQNFLVATCACTCTCSSKVRVCPFNNWKQLCTYGSIVYAFVCKTLVLSIVMYLIAATVYVYETERERERERERESERERERVGGRQTDRDI